MLSHMLHRSITRDIGLPDDGLRFVVVSDTHSHPHRDALRLVAEQGPDYILHGGDIGALTVLDALEEIAPTIAVRGNIDGRGEGPPDSVTLNLQAASGAGLRILLTHIAVRGPRLRADVRREAAKERAALVVCGHSHMPLIGRDGDVAIFNPGSIGARRFRLPIVFGVMDVAPTGVSMRHICCETGEQWHPVPIAAPS